MAKHGSWPPAELSGKYFASSVHQHYTLGVQCGEGCNGTVLAATSAAGERCAVKRISLEGASAELARGEACTLAVLDHPHIVQLRAVHETDSHLYLVLERLEGGELLDQAACGQMKEQLARRYLQQMVLAVSHLHGRGMMHRDIKLENFMFEDKHHKFLKLIDFGFAAEDSGSDLKLMGTPSYCAPEVLAGCCSRAGDIWSLGVVAYAMLTGEMPGQCGSCADSWQDRLESGLRSRGVSSHAADFVTSLLQMHPALRPRASALSLHPWLRDARASSPSRPTLSAFRDFAAATSERRRALQLYARCLPPADRRSLRGVFLDLDHSKCGVVKMADFVEALTKRGVAQDEARHLFATMASDHHVISYSDVLAALCAGTRAPRSAEAMERSFELFSLERSCKGTSTLFSTRAPSSASVISSEVGAQESFATAVSQPGIRSRAHWQAQLLPRAACCFGFRFRS